MSLFQRIQAQRNQVEVNTPCECGGRLYPGRD